MAKKASSERAVFSVALDLPNGVSVTQMRRYIENALQNYFDDSQSDKAERININFSIKLLERHVKYTR